MKILFVLGLATTVLVISCKQSARISSSEVSSAMHDDVHPVTSKDVLPAARSLFIDEHDLPSGKVNFSDVLAAHQKDLATEGKYGVDFIKFWVDESKGKIYCLSSAPDSESIVKTHAEAHGLVPSRVFKVTDGKEVKEIAGEQFFLDVHELGAGNVTAAAVAQAHLKDLAVEKKYGVNFINYWVDSKNGTVFCLSEAADSNAVIRTHKEAHGLLPAFVLQVREGK